MTGTVQKRSIKEIYISDYDGENQTRVTTGRTLNIAPRWSPDGRSIAYTSYRRGGAQPVHLEHLPGHAGRGDQRRQGRRELAAGLVARRHEARLQLDARRQPGDLRREPRRLGPAAADEQPEHRHHADLVALRHADRVHLRSQRLAADLRRRRRRAEPLEEDVRVVLRPADLVAGAVQRDRLRGAQRPGLRHPRARPVDRRHQVAHLRRGHQREPGVLAQRPPHRLHKFIF